MIKISYDKFSIKNDLDKLNCSDPYICKIVSLYNCYGTNATFADFWCQYNDYNNPIAIIAKIDNQAIVYCTENTDFTELSNFIFFITPQSFLCNKNLRIDGYSNKYGKILNYCKENKNNSQVVNNSLIEICNLDKFNNLKISLNLKDVHALLMNCKSDNFAVPSYNDFLADLSYRLNKNIAIVYLAFYNGVLAGCCIVSAQTDYCDVITSVAVYKEYRHKQVGTKLVNCVLNKIVKKNKSAFVFRAENENIDFYEKIGFKEVGTWYEYKIT